MTFPTDVGIIDLMLTIPTGHEQDWYEFLKPQLLDEESKRVRVPGAVHVQGRPAGTSTRTTTRSPPSLEQMDKYGIEQGDDRRRPRQRGTGDCERHRAAPRPLLRLATGSTRTAAWRPCATSSQAYETFGIKAATAFPAGLLPAGADQRQAVLSRSTPSASSSTSRSAAAPACPGPRVPMACQKVELIDEVCWFFPELKFVMRHGAEPWTDARREADAQVAEPLLLDARVRAPSTTRRRSSTTPTPAAPTRSCTPATSRWACRLERIFARDARACRSRTRSGRSSCARTRVRVFKLDD